MFDRRENRLYRLSILYGINMCSIRLPGNILLKRFKRMAQKRYQNGIYVYFCWPEFDKSRLDCFY
jgi:hypothetical protein